MKKIFLGITLIICVFGFGQENNLAVHFNGLIVKFNNKLTLNDIELADRGNTVGQIEVTPLSYKSNDRATTITVGASGADYTDLSAAISAASANDVIEIIDDTYTLSAQLTINKPKDISGNALKIKGKPTKTTLILANANPSIRTAGANTSIVFEDIIFDCNFAVVPFQTLLSASLGYAHIIDCTFDGGSEIRGFSSSEYVLDSVDFINQSAPQVMYFENASIPVNSRVIINEVTCNYSSGVFLNHVNTGINLSKISITNSDIYIGTGLLFGCDDNVDTVDVRGNKIGVVNGAGTGNIGLEASGSDISGIDAYDGGTAYTIGDLVDYTSNLWECTQNTTGNAPSKTSDYWKVAELVTGTISQNTFYRTTYSTTGHGLFLGFGTYNFTVTNNIINNYWYNYVIKGVNNNIQYNCAGQGFRGFSVFANNQNIFSNNTSRTEDDYGLQVNVQSAGGTTVDSTTFRDNIFTTVPTGDDVMLIGSGSSGNIYTQNIVYGDSPLISFEGTDYDASNATELNNYRIASGDSYARFLDPQWVGYDSLSEQYYLPSNPVLLQLRDANNQSVGAIDATKY